MEKENHGVVNGANYSPIKNQYEPAELKDPRDEMEIQEKHFRTEMIEGREGKRAYDGKEDEELLSPHEIFGLCAICQLTLERMNFNQNENAPCSKGHTLCQRCAKRFTIPSDRGCILCHAECRQSSVNLSRQSSISLDSVRQKRTLNLRPKSDYSYSRDQQQQRVNVEQLYSKTLGRSCAPFVPNVDRSLLGYCTDDNSEISIREQFRDRSTNFHEGRARTDHKHRQQPSSCNLFKKGNGEPCDAKVNGQITAECSRRPIRCPRIDCAINVAFSALTHHFVFDHPEVPILNVEPGVKSTLIVSFNALSANSSRCLALLLVSGKLSDPAARLFNGCQINPKYRNRLPLPVLAARLQSTDQYVSNEKNSKRNSCQEKDLIIAWVAGLDIGNSTEKLLCSIQAVDKIDNEGLRSLTYTGPVNSLRTAQCPRDIFSAGDCIVLHEGLLSHITSDCVTLNVNVTVH